MKLTVSRVSSSALDKNPLLSNTPLSNIKNPTVAHVVNVVLKVEPVPPRIVEAEIMSSPQVSNEWTNLRPQAHKFGFGCECSKNPAVFIQLHGVPMQVVYNRKIEVVDTGIPQACGQGRSHSWRICSYGSKCSRRGLRILAFERPPMLVKSSNTSSSSTTRWVRPQRSDEHRGNRRLGQTFGSRCPAG